MRPAETHRCPVVLKALRMAALTARSSDASSQTMTALMAAVAHALRDNGLFVFSVEATTSGDVVLGNSHRYAHSLAYIQRLAAASALTVSEQTCCEVRRDGDTNVMAHLIVLRRHAAAVAA